MDCKLKTGWVPVPEFLEFAGKMRRNGESGNPGPKNPRRFGKKDEGA